MELQEQDIAMLEAYLSGELDGDALRECEARLSAEPELAAMLAMMQDLEGAATLTAKGGLRKDFQAAKAAAVAAGMVQYTPSINAPKSPPSSLWRFVKFLIKLGILGGIGWAIWKYVLDEKWPPQLGVSTSKVETKSTTKTTIKRDTIQMNGGH